MASLNEQKGVVTRFPPSPTGYLHIGRARTALFNYLFTQQNSGKMVFRIEDTDKERSKKEYEENIIDCLTWLGIGYDEGPHRQSERNEVYKKYLKKLVDEKKAYISKEKITEGEKAGQENEVVRFKNPNKKITFTDLIRGEITFNTEELGDFIIARNINDPLYHLTVVVDDFEMGITHIIRGEDHISNTPRQILIQEGIGAPRPMYGHIPLILAPDRSKLSGRHGAVAVTEYREKGYLPEAIINYLALLGWNPGTEQEIFSMQELIEQFDLTKVQKGGAIFNIEKLNWINKEYIKKLPIEKLIEVISQKLSSFNPRVEMVQKLTPIIVDRINTFSDIDTLIKDGELDYFFNEPELQKDLLHRKKEPDIEKTKTHLNKIIEIISSWEGSGDVKNLIMPYAEAAGKGNVLWPTRYALSGKEKSPDPFTLITTLGKETTIARLNKAIHALS